MLKLIWKKIRGVRCNTLFFMQRITENLWVMKLASRKKKLDHKTPTRKNFWIHKIPTRNRLGPTKLPREKVLEHEASTSKNFGPMKYPQQKILYPQISTRKYVRAPKYRGDHDGRITLDPRDPRWNATHEI